MGGGEEEEEERRKVFLNWALISLFPFPYFPLGQGLGRTRGGKQGGGRELAESFHILELGLLFFLNGVNYSLREEVSFGLDSKVFRLR